MIWLTRTIGTKLGSICIWEGYEWRDQIIYLSNLKRVLMPMILLPYIFYEKHFVTYQGPVNYNFQKQKLFSDFLEEKPKPKTTHLFFQPCYAIWHKPYGPIEGLVFFIPLFWAAFTKNKMNETWQNAVTWKIRYYSGLSFLPLKKTQQIVF